MKHATCNIKPKIQIKRRRRMFHVSCLMLHEEGYTLIEILTVIFIISVLSAMTIYNYSAHKKDEILLTETQKMAQFLRRAQNLALAPQQSSALGISRNGYGVHLSAGINTVTLFADEYPTGTASYNFIYDGGTEKIEDLVLDPEVTMSVLQAPAGDGVTPDEAALNILYIPPDPIITIYNGTINTNAADALITIRLVSDSTKMRKIKVSSAGLIELQ